MNDVTLIKKGGGVECRVCGLNFVPDSEDDQERHQHEHRLIVCGGVPLEVREFLKAFGWAVAFDDGGFDRLKNNWKRETGKRAVVFSWWTRALANGIPENDFERFMQAHFAFVDAKVSRDENRIEATGEAIKPWEKYAG